MGKARKTRKRGKGEKRKEEQRERGKGKRELDEMMISFGDVTTPSHEV